MTAIAPGPNPLAELPSMPEAAEPVIVPGLLSGLGLTARPRIPVLTARPRIPAWISDPDLIASIEAGLVEIPDDLCPTKTRGA